jgi:hypothetical protein
VIEQAVRDWNAGDLDAYMSMYAEGATLHGYGPAPIDKNGGTAFYGEMMEAFPGSQVRLDDVIEAGDQLVVRYTQSGRHQGDFMGVPGTGRDFDLYGIVIDRHADGRVIERHSAADMLAVFEQLGLRLDGGEPG